MGFVGPVDIQTDGGVEFAASSLGSFKRNLEKVFTPLGVTRTVIRRGHPEDNAYVERSHRTDDEEFYIPYLMSIRIEKELLKRGIWWEYIYNLERPHQGIDNMTPYEKLKSLGYPTGEEICLFPPLILDKVCMLDLLQTRRPKSVQDHIDYYHKTVLENVSTGSFNRCFRLLGRRMQFMLTKSGAGVTIELNKE